MNHGGDPPGGAERAPERSASDMARAQDELEQRFEALADATIDGVVISAEGTVLEVNRAGAELLGVQVGDIVAHGFREWFDGPDLEIVTANIDRGLEEPYEVHLRRPDGRRVPVEIRGKNIQYLGKRARATLVRDISERRRSEAQLGRWEHLFRHASFGMATIREDQCFELVNPAFAEMHDQPMSALVHQPIWTVMAEPAARLMRAEMERAREGSRRVFESSHRRRDGGEFPVLIDLSVLPPDEEGHRHHAFYVRDQTAKKDAERERSALEERVRHAEKLESLGILAGGIAHDFNNLLVGILGNADVLVTELPEGSPARNGAESLRNAARRAAELTQQMLAYSGKGRFVLASINLGELLLEMDVLLDHLRTRGVQLRIEVADGLPTVPGDAVQLRQVFMNLITNAADALKGRAGVVRVETGLHVETPDGFTDVFSSSETLTGEHVYVDVVDDGVGMDAETVRRMFEPFFTTKFAGRGLGLAAALGIVRAHNGSILVRSAPGQGTVVRVLLPAERSEKPRVAPAQIPTPSPWRGSGRALVVDDEVAVRHVASAILTRVGFEVVVARSGSEALQLFDADPDAFRFVLLDMTMPELSGAEVFRALRARRPELHVLLSSGYDESQAVSELGSAEPVHFIQKPYEVATLIARVRSLLEGEAK